MTENISKKSYYLPDELTDFFVKWCKPGRDYSPKVAAGMLLYMALPPDLQQEAERLACASSIDNAIVELRELLEKSTVNRKLLEFLETLTDDQKTQVLGDIAASKGKTLRKK